MLNCGFLALYGFEGLGWEFGLLSWKAGVPGCVRGHLLGPLPRYSGSFTEKVPTCWGSLQGFSSSRIRGRWKICCERGVKELRAGR